MPAHQILEEIVEVVKAVKIVPQERISEGIGEQIVDMPVPQILEEAVERTSAWSCEQIVDAFVPHAVDELASQCQEETLERIQRTVDPVQQFQFQEETVEVNQLIPASRTSNRRGDRRRRAAQQQAAQQAWRDGATWWW